MPTAAAGLRLCFIVGDDADDDKDEQDNDGDDDKDGDGGGSGESENSKRRSDGRHFACLWR